ncbi:SDR family oxidoreductase [Thioclava atlantica]|uniref:Dehydrogenase n=1 Tax=Thioclava atlantica TaxID=1317124 RepID=A0A085U005_9RHOB|nr:SDR family oxidoreductase [Thioclava atlantica]KFE36302.1 dehydrogenase [Thioclava atlantica]
MDFANKTVLITGASRGIGAATVRHFAQACANVVMLARDAKALDGLAAEVADAGGRALALPGDVSRFADLEAAVAQAVETFGGLDILVNNAAVIEPIARLAESDPEVWSRGVDINLKGVYHAMRAAIPAMLERGAGVVVNISSGAATGVLEGWSNYCATKAAVLSLTRCADLEYAAQGIRVVGLSPGTVATDMQVAIRASGINPVSQLDPSAHIPPEWVARGIAYLCTEAGADFAGTDFSLKTDEGRARIGLPPVGR